MVCSLECRPQLCRESRHLYRWSLCRDGRDTREVVASSCLKRGHRKMGTCNEKEPFCSYGWTVNYNLEMSSPGYGTREQKTNLNRIDIPCHSKFSSSALIRVAICRACQCRPA